jgi:hypothetical protein
LVFRYCYALAIVWVMLIAMFVFGAPLSQVIIQPLPALAFGIPH